MEDQIRQQIENYVKSFRWTPEDFYWEHAFHVRELAIILQENVGGNKDVIEASALLHDIGKAKLLGPKHEKISAKLAEEFLIKIGFNKEKIKKIIECILYENFNSIEAKILRSADSMALILDEMGRKWYFKVILKNDKEKILKELEKSYSEIEFDFAKEFIEESYQNLIRIYS